MSKRVRPKTMLKHFTEDEVKAELASRDSKIKEYSTEALVKDLQRRALEVRKKALSKFHMNTLFTHRWKVHHYNTVDMLTCAKRAVVSHNKYMPHEGEDKRPVDGWFVVRLRTDKDKRKWAIFDDKRMPIKNKRGNVMYFSAPALAILHAENVAARRLRAKLIRMPRNIGEMLAMLKEHG
ncbi:MAG: hypothetical protein MN733_21575 [Nitrososphaera sp.]|nr:hypothetical protein [Nitrososphaera sp.]